MVTRRRTSSTRRSTSGRSTTARRTTRRRTTGTRRRSPKLATTLGSAIALALVAGWVRLSWMWRGVLVGGLLALLVIYFLWSRRGAIYDEMQTDQSEPPRTEPAPEEPQP
ncbi:MAG: hypothetical protein U0Q19_04035 [Kineosporiaceae bacterium]